MYFRKNVIFQEMSEQIPLFLDPIFIIFAPICGEIFTLSFEIMLILDWTSPLKSVDFMHILPITLMSHSLHAYRWHAAGCKSHLHGHGVS